MKAMTPGHSSIARVIKLIVSSWPGNAATMNTIINTEGIPAPTGSSCVLRVMGETD